MVTRLSRTNTESVFARAVRAFFVFKHGRDAVQGRLPVEISARYWSGDQQRTDRAIYDVVFTTEGRIFAGRKLRLKGVVLRRRVSGDGGATLDSMWKTERKRLQSLKK